MNWITAGRDHRCTQQDLKRGMNWITAGRDHRCTQQDLKSGMNWITAGRDHRCTQQDLKRGMNWITAGRDHRCTQQDLKRGMNWITAGRDHRCTQQDLKRGMNWITAGRDHRCTQQDLKRGMNWPITEQSHGSDSHRGHTHVAVQTPGPGLAGGTVSVEVTGRQGAVTLPEEGSTVSGGDTEDQNKGEDVQETSINTLHRDGRFKPATQTVSPGPTVTNGMAHSQPATVTIATTGLRRDPSGKGTTKPQSTNHTPDHMESQGEIPPAVGPESVTKGPEKYTDWSVPNVTAVVDTVISTMAVGAERAQYQPDIQTALYVPNRQAGTGTHTKPTDSLVIQPSANTRPSTRSPDSQPAPDWQGSNSTVSGVRHGPDGKPVAATLIPTELKESTPLIPSTANEKVKTASTQRTTPSPTIQLSPSTAQPSGSPTTRQQKRGIWTTLSTSTPHSETTATSTASPTTKDTGYGTGFVNLTSSKPLLPNGRGRMELPGNNGKHVDKESSLSLGYVPSESLDRTPSSPALPSDPCPPGSGPCVAPNDFTPINGSVLVWADLSRTLSFAWELHVFGSAALFLLLTAGSALGLFLAPSTDCPHRGALAIANSLLLLTGVLRSVHFLLDPYGTRLFLPPPVVTALYTLPLPLLLWAQAAVVLLVLQGAGVTVLTPTLEQPPLLAVLAVLHCTLLLAVDLLSPALSPAVPVVLQSLTLTAGLVLCLGYLCLVLPRLTKTQPPRRGGADKALGGAKLRLLARVLAVCSLLGALCCLLHAHACLWLYGLLGNWRRFSWAWWLGQFWARLLELAWSFCLLLLSSWVFWRPRGGPAGNGQGSMGQGGTTLGDLPSPCQSAGSSHRHTCWAKIVQSLRGRPHRKSDSNGLGGANSGSVTGELPNNWAGQERSGADISKSLIRNRDPPKESNRGRNQRANPEGSMGSLLRLQTLGLPPHRSLSGSLDQDKESALSLYDFDLRPPSPIDLSRSIDNALHREHLFRGSLFRPLGPPSPPPSPTPWLRRNSDPQLTLTSASSDEHTLLTESSAALDRSIPSAVPSRQVTAPPTPTHQGPRWTPGAPVPSSLSCPVSLQPSPNSHGTTLTPSMDDTRPFLTPDTEGAGSQQGCGRRYLKVARQDDTASVSSDIIDL
ncbi:proline-rich transmembrane protein 3 [Chanos chanos]|uniref:Proline-rich transmembrane protein 3 n=1 Tax=Chanos chanos TaxID=29144 RepID=A0A6J2W6R6_CHACN|nr:proline-rich transmembrane protein 3-like [Chanos chanos]